MYDPKHPLIAENDKRDLWFKDHESNNCFHFPKGWADENADDEEEKPELYGYYPTQRKANSEVNNGWILCEDVEKMTEITEAEARDMHPALAAHLNKINAED